MSICNCVRCSEPVDTDFRVEAFDMIGKCLCSGCEFVFREKPFVRARFALDYFEQATIRNYTELKDAAQVVIQHIDNVMGELHA